MTSSEVKPKTSRRGWPKGKPRGPRRKKEDKKIFTSEEEDYNQKVRYNKDGS